MQSSDHFLLQVSKTNAKVVLGKNLELAFHNFSASSQQFTATGCRGQLRRACSFLDLSEGISLGDQVTQGAHSGDGEPLVAAI